MRGLALGLLLLVGCDHAVLPGTRCRKHEECVGLKDGYCSKAEICTRECSDDKPCPEGFSRCVAQGSRRVCLAVCATAEAQCQKGEACVDNVCVVAAPLEPPVK